MRLIFALLLVVLISCSKSDDATPEIQLLANTDVETGSGVPTAWWVTNVANTSYSWSDQEAYSGVRSLKVQSSLSQALFPFWGQSIATDLPFGKNLTLRVRIKGNLTGEGASVAIACLKAPSDKAQQFSTTEGSTSIKGNFDWTEYSVKLNGVQNDITEIRVYLILLPNTTGEVYFDDITLTAN